MIDFGSWGQRSRSNSAFCLLKFVDIIKTAFLDKSVVNVACKFMIIMMRGLTELSS